LKELKYVECNNCLACKKVEDGVGNTSEECRLNAMEHGGFPVVNNRPIFKENGGIETLIDGCFQGIEKENI
jgi:hypothetical protein